jgi:hypothetical protein
MNSYKLGNQVGDLIFSAIKIFITPFSPCKFGNKRIVKNVVGVFIHSLGLKKRGIEYLDARKIIKLSAE